MVKMSRPVILYHGGKWKLAPWVIEHFPPHHIYTEVFGGGGSVLMRKERSYGEVYNDIEGEIVNVFRILRDPATALELRRRLELTVYAREEFNDSYLPGTDPMDRAHKMLIRAYMGFGSASMTRTHKTGFRSNSNRSGTTPATDWANYPAIIPAFVDRLKGVTVEQKDALVVIKQHDEKRALHYVDPPYVWETRSSKRNSRHSYKFEMSNEQHCELAKVLHSLKGKVIISGYACDLYESLYPGWVRRERKHHADGAKVRTEVLWMNYEPELRLI